MHTTYTYEDAVEIARAAGFTVRHVPANQQHLHGYAYRLRSTNAARLGASRYARTPDEIVSMVRNSERECNRRLRLEVIATELSEMADAVESDNPPAPATIAMALRLAAGHCENVADYIQRLAVNS